MKDELIKAAERSFEMPEKVYWSSHITSPSEYAVCEEFDDPPVASYKEATGDKVVWFLLLCSEACDE